MEAEGLGGGGGNGTLERESSLAYTAWNVSWTMLASHTRNLAGGTKLAPGEGTPPPAAGAYLTDKLPPNRNCSIV